MANIPVCRLTAGIPKILSGRLQLINIENHETPAEAGTSMAKTHLELGA